ncbi:hypothetical protein [Candidatus Ruminimicrobiellum ovillum]|uniref:hypothetical protein n=1 Tax=Candidatus Ruminimicrobiellum ovillum TaxID=1947927 RepID=UPI003559698B
MKKIIFLLLTFVVLVGCSGKVVEEKTKLIGMANPWTDCGTDFEQASLVAGFTFPLKLSKCDVRAMKNMIEINYPLDETRTVCVRKTDTEKLANDGDISGVYIEYPVNKEIMLKGAVPLKIRGTEDKIYVMNMAASNGYYSAYCKDGMTIEEIEGIYDIIAEAETSQLYSNH